MGDFFISGSVDVGFKGAHAAGLVFAHHKLKVVLAEWQVEAGGVLDIFPRDLLGMSRCRALPFRAHFADIWPGGLLHGADDVERGLVCVAALDERNLRAWDNDETGT